MRCLSTLGLVKGLFMQDRHVEDRSTPVLSIPKGALNGEKDQFGLYMGDKFLVFAQQK